MSKTAMIRARTEAPLKKTVDSILKKIGLSQTEAITLYYYQIKPHGGLPFSVQIPNATTEKTFKKSDSKKELHKVKNKKQLWSELEI